MSNVASTLEQRLPRAEVDLLQRAGDVAYEHGAALFLVGGSVRDLLVGLRPADLDLSVAAASPQFAQVLARHLNGEVAARSLFGTAKLIVGGAVVDLAATRTETYAHPGALPTISPGSIDEDLARRDFTINSMAISLAPASWANLMDPFGGRGDVKRGLVRVLHERSFVDDATRILRAVRYAAKLTFEIEPDTVQLLRRDLRYLDTIKVDRVRHEVERVFGDPRSVAILRLAQELGVLSAVHPMLRLDDTALANLEHPPPGYAVEGPLPFVALLAYSMPADEHQGLIARLNMDARWSRTVRDTGSLVEAAGRLKDSTLSPSQLYRLVCDYDDAAVLGLRLATSDVVVASHLDRYLGELRQVEVALNGDDLMSLGVKEGPLVGELLEELLDARLDGRLSSRRDEERFVRDSLAGR